MFRAIPNYPGYCIAANGDVWSLPKVRIGKSDGALKMRFQYAGKLLDKPFVELVKPGKKRGNRIAVFQLLKTAWPEIFPEFMKRYGYV